MPTKLIKHLPLILILFLALSLRAFRIDSFPPLNPDEAAIAYNAFSLIETGHDEHGNLFPIHFKSFGDFKPGGYFYLALPFVKLLGLTPLAVRLPNLILSLLAIFLFYKIVFLISSNQKLSLISIFVLSISPWHIHFSRGAWESNTALSLIIIGTYFFLKSTQPPKFSVKYFTLFLISFSSTLYIYHSTRIFAPLLGLILFAIYFKTFYKNFRQLFLPILFTALISVPVLFSFINNGGTTRFGGVGLTADQGPIWRANELINQDASTDLFYRIIHNKRLLYTISWAQKYFSHFDLNFLFLTGDEVPRSKSPEMGQFYLYQLLFLLVGLFSFIKTKLFDLKSKQIIIFWLIFAPLASSLTFQAPSALRSLPLVIPLSLFISLGLYHTLIYISRLSNYLLKYLSYLIVIFIIIVSVIFYLDSYYIHSPARYPQAWNYGFSQLVNYFQKNPTTDPVYITNKYDQPYIMILFYTKYPPHLIQKEIKLTTPDQFGFSTVTHFGNYYFQKIIWEDIPENSVIVASDEEIPIAPTDIIYFPNHQPALKIYYKHE